MRIFRKREKTPQEAAPEQTWLLSEEEVRAQLDEALDIAAARDEPLVVLCLAPQLLPGQTLAGPEFSIAIEVLQNHLRPTDYVGRLGAERFLAVLPDTHEKPGQIVAHRASTELTLRSTRFNHRKWFGGFAAFPLHGGSAEDLIAIASDHAQARPSAAA